MFKFLYCTDIHGHVLKYNKVYRFAIENNIKIINIGADLLPNYRTAQEKFVKAFLNRYYSKCKKNNIELLAQFGNDDPPYLKNIYKGTLLYNNPFNVGDYIFYGYDKVLDYPFCNKDLCKLDHKDWKRPPKEEYGLGYEEKLKKGIVDELDFLYEINFRYRNAIVNYSPFYFDNDGNKIEIKDLDEYLNKKPTIEDDLRKMYGGKNTIYCIHQPPYKLGLDVIYKKDKNGKNKEIGSKSVYEWAQREKPLLILCGHAHESFDVTGKWKEKIGETIVIQPGQSNKNFDKVIVVYIEIENFNVVNAVRIEL